MPTPAADYWDPALSVGNALIDSEHLALFGIIHKLKLILAAGSSADAAAVPSGLPAVFAEIAAYTVTHFSHEEELMRDSGYLVAGAGPEQGTNAQAMAHLAQHQRFIREFEALSGRLERGELTGMALVQGEYLRLSAWLVKHIKEKDQAFADFLRAAEKKSASTPLSQFNRF
jgi:hemerythrin-like metal-binding protein